MVLVFSSLIINRFHFLSTIHREIMHSDHSRRSSSHTNDFHPHPSPSPHQHQLQHQTHQSPHRPTAPTTPTAGGSSSCVSTPRMTPRSPLPIPPASSLYGNNESVNQYFANAIRAKSQQPLGGSYPITPPPRNQPQPSYPPNTGVAAATSNYGNAPTADSNYAPLYANKINFAGYTSNLNGTSKAASRSSSLLCHHSTGTDSPLMAAKRRDNHKLAYRYSDASTWDIKASKNKKNRRNYHSMSETMETLADTVVEDADLMPVSVQYALFFDRNFHGCQQCQRFVVGVQISAGHIVGIGDFKY